MNHSSDILNQTPNFQTDFYCMMLGSFVTRSAKGITGILSGSLKFSFLAFCPRSWTSRYWFSCPGLCAYWECSEGVTGTGSPGNLSSCGPLRDLLLSRVVACLWVIAGWSDNISGNDLCLGARSFEDILFKYRSR